MINKTILQGRLVDDPELRHTPSNVAVVSFKVAWSEKYKETETKCFLTCTAWRNTGEFVSKYFNKGQEIVVEGQLTTRSYKDKEGNNRSVTELIVYKAHFCGKKQDGETTSNLSAYTPAAQSDFEEVEDGELPF